MTESESGGFNVWEPKLVLGLCFLSLVPQQAQSTSNRLYQKCTTSDNFINKLIYGYAFHWLKEICTIRDLSSNRENPMAHAMEP